MGRDKATIVAGGASLAERAAAALRAVARPLLAVGPEAGTGCDAVDDPRRGPLVAFDAGSDALASLGHDGPVVLLACDMPLVSAGMLADLTRMRRGADAVVPIAGGRLQPLCAVYAPRARVIAHGMVADGARSMRDLLAALRIEIVPGTLFARDGTPDPFADVDTPGDLARIEPVLDAPA